MKGRVFKSTGSFYSVQGIDNKFYNCRARGKLRLEGYKESNPLAVGDMVMFDVDGNEGTISEILPRTNHVLRQSVKRTEHSSVLAANVDQAMLIGTVSQPRTSVGFIDRFMVACEAYRIPQILIINKSDLLDEEAQQTVQIFLKTYSSIGIKVAMLSAANAASKEIVLNLISGKTTLFAGHSGVGKSTLLNLIAPWIKQTTNNISASSEKGMHTTTFAEMFQLSDDTFIIDTPGVKEWGLVDMNEQELSDYFPEMRDLRLECKFGSKCLHIHEPKCAIMEAVEAGKISLSRYENYLSMVSGKDNRK